MNKQKILNFIKNNSFSLFTLVLSIVMLILALGFPKVPSGYGPGFFPIIVCTLAIGLSLIDIISKFRESLNTETKMDKVVTFKIIYTVISLILLAVLMEYVHPLVGIFLFILGYIKLIAKENWIKTLIISVIGTAGLYVVILLLRIPL